MTNGSRSPATRPTESRFQLYSGESLSLVEMVLYAALGLILSLAALFALFTACQALWQGLSAQASASTVVEVIDRLLVVFMLVEILHTVRISIRSEELTLVPFLIVGLIASIRRVLVITTQAAKLTQEGHGTGDSAIAFRNSMIELGVARTLPLVAVPATRRAQPLAVGATERREGHLDADHVADHLVGVQLPFRTQRVRVRALVRMPHEQLVEVQVERLLELHETPGAPEAPPAADVARNEDALHKGLQHQIGPDRGILRHPRQLRRETLDRPDDRFLPRGTRAPHQVTDVDRGKHQSLPASSVSPCSS